MSGAHAKKKMVTGEKPATSHGKAPSGESGNKREESPPRVKSHRSGDKKKKMKKVVYYETDSSSPSTSGSNTPYVTSKRHERKKFSKIPLRYPRISKHSPLLSIPLGKPSVFNGEDYCMWSDKMRHHLTSLHASIWDIVEFGAQEPSVGDEGYDSDEVAQIRHFNSQATIILFASLSRKEYNKVQGSKSVKGKCALGSFLSILVIECKHKCSNVNLCPWVNKVQITSKGMFLSLSTLVLCTNIPI
jgi:hypothetical protein